MKYTVQQLDAMPVGTVLIAKTHMFVRHALGKWCAPWFEYHLDPDPAGGPYWWPKTYSATKRLYRFDFTHRADPAPTEVQP